MLSKLTCFYITILLASTMAAAELESFPPLFLPPGLTAGPVIIFPSFDYSLTYMDNANRANKLKRDDFLQEYRPATAIRFNASDLISIRAGYEFGWHDYAENEAPDYLSHRGYFDIRLKNFKVEGLNLVFSERYRQSGNSDPLDNETISFERYHANNVSAGVDYETGSFSITGRIYHSLMDYFSGDFDASGYQTYGGEILGEYRLDERHLALFGTLSSTRTLRESTDVDDYDTHSILMGARGYYSKLNYSVAIGYTLADFIHRDDHESGPSVLALLRYNPTERLEFLLQARRRFQPATTGGLTTETYANFTTRIKLYERARILLDLTRNESDREVSGRLVSTGASVAFEYAIARIASIRAGYAHIERKASDGLPEFRINEVQFGFHLAW